METSAAKVAGFLGLALVGEDVPVSRAASLDRAEPGALVFARQNRAGVAERLNATTGVTAIVSTDFAGTLSISHILSDNPRLDFARALEHFLAPQPVAGVAESAVVAAGACLTDGVSVGAFSVIGPEVSIGEGTEIGSHVVLTGRVTIGRRCRIRAHTVIGEPGFGFEFLPDGTPFRVPHVGGVRIGDDVEIGALNVIARGTLDDTTLGDNVKTDDHVFVAHNVRVGRNSVLIAGCEISGSVRIGDNVWVGPQASVINQAEIGEDSMVGIGAVVTKPVPPNVIVAGNPARVLRERFARG